MRIYLLYICFLNFLKRNALVFVSGNSKLPNAIKEVIKINNDSIPVGIESNSFNGFVNMSNRIKIANATLENLMKFLKRKKLN